MIQVYKGINVQIMYWRTEASKKFDLQEAKSSLRDAI